MIIIGIVAGQQSGANGIPPAISTGWRILITQTADGEADTYVSINEIEWLDTAGAVIPTTGASHIANGWDGADTASQCFDGNDETKWTGPRDDGSFYGPNPWLSTTFDSEQEVGGIRIRAADGFTAGAPMDFSIQYRGLSGAWFTKFSVVGQIGWEGNETRAFELGGRIWRLVVNSTEEGTKVAIGELQFRSTADMSDSLAQAGGFVLASSEVLPDSRFNVIDGDPATAWSTATLPASVEYWFLTQKAIEQVACFTVAGRESEAPLTTQLFYSDDFGVTFTEAGTIPVINVTLAAGYGNSYGYFYGGS